MANTRGNKFEHLLIETNPIFESIATIQQDLCENVESLKQRTISNTQQFQDSLHAKAEETNRHNKEITEITAKQELLRKGTLYHAANFRNTA